MSAVEPAPEIARKPPVPAASPTSLLDLKGLVSAFRRRLWLFLGIVIIATIAMIVAAKVMHPIYSAASSIIIDPTQKGVDQSAATMGGLRDSALVDTEVAVMQSREVAASVVRRLNLTQDPEFNPEAGAGPLSEKALEEIIQAVQSAASVHRQGSTYIVNIETRSKNPAKAAQLANTFATEYLFVSQQQRVAAAEAQQRAMSGQARELQAQAETANAAVAQYRGQTGIVSGGGGSGTVTDQQASTLAGQLSLARSDAAELNAKANAARAQISSGNLDSVSEVLSSPVIVDLRRQRTEIVREQSEIQAKYGVKHPDYNRVEQQLAGVDAQIKNESQRIANALDVSAKAASARVASLQGQLGGLEGQQASNARAAAVADSLQRRADAVTTLSTETTQAVQRANQLAQIGQTQARIIALAVAPTSASFPNKTLFAVLGVVLGALVGAALVLLLEAFDTSLRTVEDVEQRLRVPYLASVPMISGVKKRRGQSKDTLGWDHVVEKPLSGYAEALRTIRSAIKLSGDGAKVLAVASATPSAGKTTTAVALARAMAMSGDKVLLVDCDLRRNALQALLPQGLKLGLVEVLEDESLIGKAIQKDALTDADVLALTGAKFTAEDLFSLKLDRLLKTLRPAYDYIVLDCPPLLAVADARTLATTADSVLMVVRWGKTARAAVAAALSQLDADDAHVAGVILTMVDLSSRAGLGESSPFYYYKTYKNYYVN